MKVKSAKEKTVRFLLLIGRGVKFFGINARYAYIPFLIIGFGVGLFILLSALGITESLTLFADSGNALLEGAGESGRIPYPDPWTSFVEALKGTGLGGVLNSEIAALGITDTSLLNQLQETTPKSALLNAVYFGSGLLIVVALYFLAGVLTGMKIKKENGIPKGWKYTLISLILKFVIFAGIIFGFSRVIQLIPVVGSILLTFLLPLVESLFALYRGYLVQRGLKKTLGMFSFITFRDVAFYLLLTWSLYLSYFAFVALVTLLLKGQFAAMVAILLPLFCYITTFLDVYAEAYVLDKAKTLHKQ